MITPIAASAAKDFSPAEERFPLPEHAQSRRFRKVLSTLGSEIEFRGCVTPLRDLAIPVPVSFKTIERVTEAVGVELAQSRFTGGADLEPRNAPELLVLQADGMRVRERLKKKLRADDPDKGWRECKIGVVARCLRGKFLKNGEYQDPQTLLQTFVGTMEDKRAFGPLLRAEAERKGLLTAHQVIALSDAGHGLPGMWKEQFPGIEWIVDFMHTSSRLAECAAALELDEKRRRKLFHRWKGILFTGKTDKLLKELLAHAEKLTLRPHCPADLPLESPQRVLWTHIQYIETYRQHMDYPRYRMRGWPIASGHVEAMCKRIGKRMKAANKRWTHAGAEAMVDTICERASGDERWNRHWPAPVSAISLN